jgi:hypothetical protein
MGNTIGSLIQGCIGQRLLWCLQGQPLRIPADLLFEARRQRLLDSA